jgi:hypothetical protein
MRARYSLDAIQLGGGFRGLPFGVARGVPCGDIVGVLCTVRPKATVCVRVDAGDGSRERDDRDPSTAESREAAFVVARVGGISPKNACERCLAAASSSAYVGRPRLILNQVPSCCYFQMSIRPRPRASPGVVTPVTSSEASHTC